MFATLTAEVLKCQVNVLTTSILLAILHLQHNLAMFGGCNDNSDDK